MDRIAIFVDAGYFFAQGSKAIWGETKSRNLLALNESAAVAEFMAVAAAKAPSSSLLRIYWYDGAKRTGPSLEQLRLAQLDNVKLRLGFINSQGQQKGVDSLIVTDLVELARNGAIAEALLLAGDEDVRIGVQIAQSYGVRVHLLGITGPGQSQSPQLLHEADTTMVWDNAAAAKMISLQVAPMPVVVPIANVPSAHPQAAVVAPSGTNAIHRALDATTDSLLTSLTASDVADIKVFWGNNQMGVPHEFDGKLIATGRTSLGRDLSSTERQYVRKRFIAAVKAMP